jgi:sugar lactone lactonase YvrE
MKKPLLILMSLALTLLALPFLSASAGEKPFPNIVPALDDSLPEGFAIGKGHTAYNGSVDGSIYKVDLRSGEGEVLVEADVEFLACSKLGMRVDPRTNYLFVAGCENGNALVFDADTGDLIMEYTLPLPPGSEGGYQIVNDLAITKDAVYFTDSHQPLLYRLPLSKNGGLPAEDAATAIVLGGEFVNIAPEDGCCGANGIVATRNGKALIVGQSNFTQLYKVDSSTGYADEIQVDPPLSGFLDGLVMHGRTLYIMNPDMDAVQVVKLDKEMLTGEYVGVINDSSMSGVASGALFGKSLYVNNAHYDAEGDNYYSERWITKLNRHAVEPVE